MEWRMNGSRGFTLVELMVVTVVMGLVAVAVHSTYINTQRQAYTQEGVVELQQNLRAALDYMVKDIRMAHFMTPAGVNPLNSVPTQMVADGNGDGDYDDAGERSMLSLVSATSMHGYARVTGVTLGGSNLTLSLASNTMHQFDDGDVVRIFRPVTLNPVTNVFSVTGTPTGDQVVLDASSGYTAGSVRVGDLLIRLPEGVGSADFPLQVDYQLIDDPSTDFNMNQLRRRVVGPAGNTIEAFQLIASNISGIDLNYLNDAGVSTANPSEVVAIEITLTARTDATRVFRNFSGVKERSLSTTVKIHNGVTL